MEELRVPEQGSGASGSQPPALSPQRWPCIPSAAPVTILVGLTMLVVGALLGYFGRPLVTPRPLEALAVAAATPQDEVAASAADPSAATFMDAVVAQTRHFKGNADAPVTMVEFSDFQ